MPAVEPASEENFHTAQPITPLLPRAGHGYDDELHFTRLTLNPPMRSSSPHESDRIATAITGRIRLASTAIAFRINAHRAGRFVATPVLRWRRWCALGGRLWQLNVISGLVGCSVLAIAATSRVDIAAQTAPAGHFVDSVVLTGLQAPTAVRFSPDGRVFVAEKSGIILASSTACPTRRLPSSQIFAPGFTTTSTAACSDSRSIRDFPTNPWVYVLYTYDGPIGGAAPLWGTPNTDDDYQLSRPDREGLHRQRAPLALESSRAIR